MELKVIISLADHTYVHFMLITNPAPRSLPPLLLPSLPPTLPLSIPPLSIPPLTSSPHFLPHFFPSLPRLTSSSHFLVSLPRLTSSSHFLPSLPPLTSSPHFLPSLPPSPHFLPPLTLTLLLANIQLKVILCVMGGGACMCLGI